MHSCHWEFKCLRLLSLKAAQKPHICKRHCPRSLLLESKWTFQWLPQNLIQVAAKLPVCLILCIHRPLPGTSIDSLSLHHFSCLLNEALFLSPWPLGFFSLSSRNLLPESAVPSSGCSLFTNKVVKESRKDVVGWSGWKWYNSFLKIIFFILATCQSWKKKKEQYPLKNKEVETDGMPRLWCRGCAGNTFGRSFRNLSCFCSHLCTPLFLYPKRDKEEAHLFPGSQHEPLASLGEGRGKLHVQMVTPSFHHAFSSALHICCDNNTWNEKLWGSWATYASFVSWGGLRRLVSAVGYLS